LIVITSISPIRDVLSGWGKIIEKKFTMSKKENWKSPYRIKNKFYLKKNHKPESFLFGTVPSFLQSLFAYGKQPAPDVQDWVIFQEPVQYSKKPIITWIGHASFLIQLGGLNIITDPVFGNCSWLFPRCLPPGISLERLPNIDVVLISHNHRDHMDRASLCALEKHKNTHFLVPQGDKYWFDRRKFERVVEHAWWQVSEIASNSDEKNSVRFTFLPAAHWSQRGLFDKNRSLWGSWMLEGYGHTIYFAGDTAYDNHFLSIADKFSLIDVALMPVGPCEPRSWMEHSHIGSEEAGRAFLDIGARHFIPMHWGTFSFGIDRFTDPVDRLRSWWYEQREQLNAKYLHVVKAGQQTLFDLPSLPQVSNIFHRDKKDKQKEE